MSVVKINAIEVPEGKGAELERRFAERERLVERMPGFEEYQLLRPKSGETRYFVYTRWASEEAFQAWVSSPEFTRGHARGAQSQGRAPVGTGSHLLEFEVVEIVKTARSGA
ncbi:MAG: antibiotic biosynthesis monooxygenase [SAR202 cluster bacterium]|nr:antibiotic biosynthesis monooxygenase [SAR202 cluster bacterium]